MGGRAGSNTRVRAVRKACDQEAPGWRPRLGESDLQWPRRGAAEVPQAVARGSWGNSDLPPTALPTPHPTEHYWTLPLPILFGLS